MDTARIGKSGAGQPSGRLEADEKPERPDVHQFFRAITAFEALAGMPLTPEEYAKTLPKYLLPLVGKSLGPAAEWIDEFRKRMEE